MSFVKDTFNALTGKSASDAATQAADTSAQAQQNALNYLKEQEALPQQFREGALTQLGGLFGLKGGDTAAAQNLKNSSIYQATIGDTAAQEEAILRNQSATGALRSSATEQMLAENQRQHQLAATQNAMGGLQGLAGLQSYAPQIAQGMAGIGNTLAQGQIAGAQAQQAGIGNTLGLGMNALSLAGFSDSRLKSNVQPIGKRGDHEWYSWTWNDKAKELGLSGDAVGVVAQEVAQTKPDAVGMSHGYLTVDYSKLGAANA